MIRMQNLLSRECLNEDVNLKETTKSILTFSFLIYIEHSLENVLIIVVFVYFTGSAEFGGTFGRGKATRPDQVGYRAAALVSLQPRDSPHRRRTDALRRLHV